MQENNRHTINTNKTVSDGLTQINDLPKTRTLICVDQQGVVVGMVTDGDIRRGLLKGVTLLDPISRVMNVHFSSLQKDELSIDTIRNFRAKNSVILPVLSKEGMLHQVVDFTRQKSYLPIHCLIQAGGQGRRLRPLTNDLPKPLVTIQDVPIIGYVLHHLIEFGVRKITLSLHYKSDMIVEYINALDIPNVTFDFIYEDSPMGTIGGFSQLELINDNPVLIMNSDLLTKLNIEEFLYTHLTNSADLTVATRSYETTIPYGVLNVSGKKVSGIQEKPVITQLINSGIYFINPKLKEYVRSTPMDTPELIDLCLAEGRSVVYHRFSDPWIDIGSHDELNRAIEMVKSNSLYEISLFNPR
ncbi:MAG: hypothetical protein Salg2KO_05750 [Salibacteraceae bacterium]